MKIDSLIQTFPTQIKDSLLNAKTSQTPSKDLSNLISPTANEINSSQDAIKISSLASSQGPIGCQFERGKSLSAIQNLNEAKDCVNSILYYIKNDGPKILNSVCMSSSNTVLNLVQEYSL